jgi:hypothetical protein
MSEQQSSASSNAPVPSPAVIDTMTRVIMSQTDMTEEQVKAALEHTNYDLKRVIREYMRADSSTSSAMAAATSTNQMRFAEIRNFMDKSSQEYYRRQEMTKIYNEVLERKKAAAAAAAAAAAEATATTDTEVSASKL